MAEKAFKRKARIKTGPGTIAPGPAAGVHVSQNSATTGQRELGAPYRAGPAFGLGSQGNAGPGDNALNNDGRQGTQNGGYQQVDWSLQNADRGIVIPLQQRQRLQRRFGRDFSGVRLHIGPAAEQATRSLSAMAFTHGYHIWLGNRANPSDESILSHELTHVVQQGHARPLAHRGAIVLPGRAANSPVYGAAPAIPGPRGTRAPASSGGALQRWSLLGGARRLGGRVVSGVRTVGRRIANVGSNLLSLGRDALLAQVRRISPEFARLFERGGIAGFLRALVARGFRALFGGVLGRVRRIFNFGNIGERFRSLGSAFVTIISQLARNDCSGITRAAERFGAFTSRTFEPITSRIRRMANAVCGFFRDVWNAVGAPVMGFLREIGGAIWESIRGFISSIGRVIRPVKNALGSAWSRVKSWLGIEADEGTGEGGGLWNWIRDKAAVLWNRVKGPLQPILGPLRAVGGVLLVLSPVGPILLVIRAWPYLRQAFQWVRERWRDLNLVVRARQLMANTVLPAVRDGATRVGEFLVNAADWFLGLLARISGGIQSVTGRLRGGILAPLGRVVSFIAGNYRRMVEWARRGLRWAAGNARSLFRRLIEFIQPIMDALRQLAMLVVNPASIPGFVMGTLWRLLPNCLKGPIIDFIIDLLRRLLRTIPPLPQLGILWPFIRAALIGFFDRVRSFATERKVAVSNTVARIVSGASVSFIVGYLRGLVRGLWDGIVGPFEAIRDLFQLPEMIRNFLRSLGVSMCQIWAAIRCFMSTLSARAIGAFDSLMEAAGDLMENPGRIIELIRCAIQATLSAVEGVGATIANQLMALFEGPEDRIGESLGRLVGSALLDVVLAFFTAGSSTALTVIRQIAGVLRTIGRNLMRVVRMVARLIPRFLGFIRKIGGMFSRAGSRAGGLLGRIGGFFRRIAGWFRRLMQRVGRRPGRGRRPDRGRDRGPSRAERERRKRRVLRILQAQLTRGIGRIRLFLLMTGLKLRYRIRTLRLRRLGRRRHQLIIRNSPGDTIPVHEVFIDETPGGGRGATLEPQGARGPGARPHAVLRHSAPSVPTPTESLARAGYRVDREPFTSLGRGSMERPGWVNARFLRWFPPRIRRPSTLGRATLKKGRFGGVEELLKRGISRARWNGGHLIGNQFGGPGTQWNLTPMSQGLNQRAYLSAETWLRSEWNHLRRPGGATGTTNTRANASVSVSVRRYQNIYTVTKQHITSTLGIPERSVGSGAESVRIHGFVPRDVRMRVRFSGEGVRAREFTRTRRRSGTGFFSRYFNRPEAALRASAVNREDDVIMRIGEAVTRPPQSQLPPEETIPRGQRRVLRNNSTVFNFRQWRP